MCNQQATGHTREKKPGSRHCETACCKLQKRAVERFPDKLRCVPSQNSGHGLTDGN